MNTLKYKITKFDKEQKLLIVSFIDGGWAEIRLTNPLPKNLEQLEEIIKQFSAPKEAIEAQLMPDSDLSYIDNIIGIEKECERFSLAPKNAVPMDLENDDVKNQELLSWQEAQFNYKLGEALVKLGLIESNPATIPTAIL